jgi:hypothetical protein
MPRFKVTYYRTLEMTTDIDAEDEEAAHQAAEKEIGELHNSDFHGINEESYELSCDECEIEKSGIQIVL